MQDHEQQAKTFPSTLFQFIWHYLKNRKLYIAGFILIAVIWAIEMSLSPYLLKLIIDGVVRNPQNQALMLAAFNTSSYLFFYVNRHEFNISIS